MRRRRSTGSGGAGDGRAGAQLIVADANLVVYLLLPGQRSDDAVAALERDSDWRLPPLWRSEVRNALRGHVRAGDIDLSTAIAAMADAVLRFRAAEEYVDSARVLELACGTGLSAYDCEYVALAESLGVPLVTADDRILRTFRDVAVDLAAFARGQ
jgi:predicted nucleic acid-binding protein